MEENKKFRTEPTQNNSMLGSLRGNEFQMLLTLMAVIKAGILMQHDDGFECNISAEEQEAGKFDDVIFHNTFRAVSRKLNVQAKSRMGGQKISWKELVEGQAKGAFSIRKYFTSFMATKQHHPQGVQHLVLCTNIDLDDKAKSLFETFNLSDACDIFSPFGATCFRFTSDSLKISNEYNTIIRLLKECCDIYHLSNLLAAIIYDQKELDLTANNPQRPETAMLYKYRLALNSLIGEKRGKSTIHELQTKFITGSELSSNEMQFREAFEAAYKRKVDAVWEDVNAKGIKVKCKAKKQEGTAANSVCSHFPEDAITNEDIELFFQQFACVTNANEVAASIKNVLINSEIIQLQQAKIGSIEADAAFHYLYKIIHDWMTLQSDLPAQLEAKHVQHILRNTNLHLQYLNLKNLTMEYVRTVNVGKRCIKNEPLMKLPLHDFLKSNSSEEDRMPPIFTFYSSYEPRISLLILLEAFELCFDETDHTEFIFVDSYKYIEHKQTLLEILCLVDFRLVLIIECKDTTVANQLEQEMNSAFQSLEPKFPRVKKKVVLIAQIQENDPINEDAENSLVLEHFVEDSLEHIIPKYTSITMFGTDISLSALMDDQDDVKVLLELMKERNRTMMQRSVAEEHYKRIETWYIQRGFEILKIPIDNSTSKYAGELKEYVFFPPRYGEGDKLDWKSFVQCFLFFDFEAPNVKDFLNGELTIGQPDFNPPGVCEDSTTKVHIFLDEAGFGKSTYLSWLGRNLQNTDRTWWVIRFNSIDYSTDFKRLTEGDQRQTMDDTLALRIFYQMIHLGIFVRNINYHTIAEIDREREVAQQCASLLTISGGIVIVNEKEWKRMKWTPLQLVTVRFFTKQFNNRKLVILFDGFDEVVPHYKEVVYDLLSRFEGFEGILKMYITSRPYNLTDEFCKVFQNVSFYKLKPFSDKNILTMVHMFMKGEFKSYLGSKSVEYCLEGLSLAIKYYLGTFSQVPLFIRMALDVLRPLTAQHVSFTDCTITKAFFDSLETNFEQLNLIEKFVENKIAKANGEKIQLTDSASNIAGARSSLQKILKHTLKTHSMLSLYVLFDHTERERLHIDEQQAIECMDEVNGGNENSGIIEAVVDDRPIFIHRTFAEYFAALWFYRNKGNAKVSSFMKSFAFWESDRGELRDFFDRMIIKQSGRSPIHVAILENTSDLVKGMIKKNPDLLRTTDVGERSMLHLLVLRSSTNILAESTRAR
uniref:NACHT domain-containing protein n=1 Tax=Anopheles atroparvus TaxID=41427 RepID=A0AAG5DPU4_ANOAO